MISEVYEQGKCFHSAGKGVEIVCGLSLGQRYGIWSLVDGIHINGWIAHGKTISSCVGKNHLLTLAERVCLVHCKLKEQTTFVAMSSRWHYQGVVEQM
jgi:hypothetical protein